MVVLQTNKSITMTQITIIIGFIWLWIIYEIITAPNEKDL